MKRYITSCMVIVWIVALLLPVVEIKAEQFNGGEAYQYTTSARTIAKKAWYFKSHSRASSISIDGASESLTNLTAAASVNYGLFKNFELELTTIVYQDVAYKGTTNTPDGFYYRWKFGNLKLTNNIFYGFQGTLRGFLGDYANVDFEPYYSDTYSAQVNVLLSYYRNPDFPSEGLQVHYNGGIVNYNDGDGIGSSTSAYQAYFAIVYPFSPKFVGSFESHGTYFLTYRDGSSNIRSIEPYGYFTPSVTWKFAKSWAFLTGIDVLVYEGEDATTTNVQARTRPNYPSWRASSKLIWNPFGDKFSGRRSRGRMTGRNRLPIGSQYDIYNRTTLYDWGGYVRDDIEYVEVELDKIRMDRKRAEEDLQKIKDQLKKELAPPVEEIEEEVVPVVEEPVVPEIIEEVPAEENTSTEEESQSQTQEEPPEE